MSVHLKFNTKFVVDSKVAFGRSVLNPQRPLIALMFNDQHWRDKEIPVKSFGFFLLNQ